MTEVIIQLEHLLQEQDRDLPGRVFQQVPVTMLSIPIFQTVPLQVIVLIFQPHPILQRLL